MILERTLIYSLYTTFSIYFRMTVPYKNHFKLHKPLRAYLIPIRKPPLNPPCSEILRYTGAYDDTMMLQNIQQECRAIMLVITRPVEYFEVQGCKNNQAITVSAGMVWLYNGRDVSTYQHYVPMFFIV